jgi:mannose-6-phosphate isomerase-like protein (cupin superfamily)
LDAQQRSRAAIKELEMTAKDLQPVAIPPDAGWVLHTLGVRHKLTELHTGGAIYFFDSEFGPGVGNRLHVHRYEDEMGYVLEGALAIRLGDQELQLSAGGIAYLPKKIPHALHNPLSTTSRYLFAAIPGGYIEHWFEAVEAATESGGLDDEAYRSLALRYGIEWLE